MLNILFWKMYNRLFPVNTNMERIVNANIIQTEDGRFALVGPKGLVASYARARDARRGAVRAGLTVA